MDPVPTIRKVLAATAFAIFAVVGLLLVVNWRVQTTVDSFKKFTGEFAVGKPSIDFIRRAREMGAERFIVVPTVQTADDLQLYIALPDKSDPRRATYEDVLKGDEQHLDRLEAKFRTMREGSAQVAINQFMFLTDHCKIEFKDGMVTKMRVFQLE